MSGLNDKTSKIVLALLAATLVIYFLFFAEPKPPPPAPAKCPPRVHIHFPLSVTTKDVEADTIADLPLTKWVLASIAATAEPWRFSYSIGIGADAGDRWLDNVKRQESIRQWWREVWPDDCPPPLNFHIFDNTRNCNVWAVNYLAEMAYHEGADAFYRINDDSILKSTNWSSRLWDGLQRSPIPGCGVIGPYDDYHHGRIMTHSMVGRCHFEVHGTYFPYEYCNYYSDNWVQDVYTNLPLVNGSVTNLQWTLRDIEVEHKHIKERYRIHDMGKLHKALVALDREILIAALRRRIVSPL